MFTDFLDPQRRKVWQEDLPVLAKEGVLGGGTAIAFQIGHRASYDFDIFFNKKVPQQLLRQVNNYYAQASVRPLVDSGDELSVLVDNKIKLTFLYFPFPPLHKVVKTDSLPVFHLKDLASNKAYSIGRRPACRDYVDLFFLLKKGIKLKVIVREAEQRFGGSFSEKLFLEQLTYLEDLENFRVDFIGNEYRPEQIKKFLASKVNAYLDQD